MSGLLVAGTASGAGKSTVVTALCRALSRQGASVAPFKAQNMSNQSAVTADGAEIGRAQYAQAIAAGAEPEAAMNPVLLKPTTDCTSQLVVLGRPAGTVDAFGTGDRSLLPVALDALASLRSRFDVVVAEGAGSCAELNLLGRDIANLPLAAEAGLPAVLVADIDRGGVYASVAGTLAVLPLHLRARIRGVVVNKLRGEPGVFDTALLSDAAGGLPVLGVLPWLDGRLPEQEDSLDLSLSSRPCAATIDVAVVAWPRLANATDLDPLLAEPGVAVRPVWNAAQLGRPHLVVLPGTKATIADLRWLRVTGLADAIGALPATSTVLGICGGLQALGRRIVDDGVESGTGTDGEEGLGLLDVVTTFHADKLVRRVPEGYEIRHGRLQPEGTWFTGGGGRVVGTPVHGWLDDDGRRSELLSAVADRAGAPWAPSGLVWADHVQAHHDRLADWLEQSADVGALVAMAGA